jgi:hypothetical protein
MVEATAWLALKEAVAVFCEKMIICNSFFVKLLIQKVGGK